MTGRPGRRGRRPGAPETRQAVLDAARARFAEHGFAGTTIRAVAGDAGVDPALVHHYFGTKDALFLAALRLPADPRTFLLPAAEAGLPGVGERLVRAALTAWDDPALQPQLVAVARGMVDPARSRLVSEGFLPVVLGAVTDALGVDQPRLRTALVASQVAGLIMMRYVLRVEPLASMPAEDVVAWYGPTVQRYLEEPLP